MFDSSLHTQSCPTLLDSIDCSPLGSSVHAIVCEEYWSELPFPSPGDLPNLGIKPTSLASPALAGRFFTSEPPEKHLIHLYVFTKCQTLPSTQQIVKMSRKNNVMNYNQNGLKKFHRENTSGTRLKKQVEFGLVKKSLVYSKSTPLRESMVMPNITITAIPLYFNQLNRIIIFPCISTTFLDRLLVLTSLLTLGKISR